MKGYTSSNKVLAPIVSYEHHSAIVNDVQYNPKIGHLIGSVSDDLSLQIIDTRKPGSEAALKAENGHDDAINSISFNPSTEFIVATGSSDKTIGIWDLRNLKIKLHSLVGHQDAVTSLDWHPHEEAILGSSSYDRRIIFWDLSKVGEEQTPQDAEDGAPEMYEFYSVEIILLTLI